MIVVLFVFRVGKYILKKTLGCIECTFYCSLSARPVRQQRLGGVKQEDGVDMRGKSEGKQEAEERMGEESRCSPVYRDNQRGVWKFFPQPEVLRSSDTFEHHEG